MFFRTTLAPRWVWYTLALAAHLPWLQVPGSARGAGEQSPLTIQTAKGFYGFIEFEGDNTQSPIRCVIGDNLTSEVISRDLEIASAYTQRLAMTKQ